jgi:hypothetical protein
MGSIIDPGNRSSAPAAQFSPRCNEPFMLPRYKVASFIFEQIKEGLDDAQIHHGIRSGTGYGGSRPQHRKR